MNKKIEKLIKQFAKLPRIGGRAAQRMALALLQDKTGGAVALGQTLLNVAESVRPCPVCGILTDGRCEYCHDVRRANGQLCVVRGLEDVWTLEKAGIFHGRYHIIGGLLSGANGITPEDLNIHNLAARIAGESIEEIIFALPSTIEGKTTQHYIMQIVCGAALPAGPQLGGCAEGAARPSFSELAQGVPLGGDLDYIDDGTLSLAFGGRKKI